MNATAPGQAELPGYAGLAVGGVIATIASLGYVGPVPVNLPLQLVGGSLATLSIAYLLVLLWTAELAA